VKILRVTCTGSIDPALFIQAFEHGVDGVAVIGCLLEECHYRLGNVFAEEKLTHVRGLLELLGLSPDRIICERVTSADGARLAGRLEAFVNEIRELGPVPVIPSKKARKADKESVNKEVKHLVEDTKAYKCVECGKCTVVCPIPKFEPEFPMPRIVVLRSIEGMTDHLADDQDIWTCTTCGLCNSLCPFDVDYCGFIQGLRVQARALGNDPICSHRGLIHSATRIMAKTTGVRQDRLRWIPPDLSVSERSEVFYFVGCLPHFDTILADRNLRLTDISVAAVRLMNAAGVSPHIDNDEVCCGHDLIWTGDEENFLRLMDKNLDIIRKSGAEKVVFSCPECYRTFTKDYREFEGDLGFELLHISEYLQRLMDDGRLTFPKRESATPVTYHDSCRLGTHLEVIDSPRRLFEAAGLKIIEMENTKNRSYCCGNCAWTNCSSTTMKMQLERMRQAKRTGAEYLLTSDPKCQIHLSCAMSGELPIDRGLVDVPVKDMAIALAEILNGQPGFSAGIDGGEKGQPTPER
jgi:heterodisulfide reductase subunit D